METNNTEVSASPENTSETVVQNPDLSQEAQHLDVSDKQNQVVPELAFRQLLPVFYKHLTLLSRSEARNALAHAIAHPFENENLPKLKGANTKVVFQTAIRLFDAKLLMMYTYMRQAETNSIETIDAEMKVLQDKRAELVKHQEEQSITLSEKDSALMVETLENPPAPNEALTNLLNQGEVNNG